MDTEANSVCFLYKSKRQNLAVRYVPICKKVKTSAKRDVVRAQLHESNSSPIIFMPPTGEIIWPSLEEEFSGFFWLEVKAPSVGFIFLQSGSKIGTNDSSTSSVKLKYFGSMYRLQTSGFESRDKSWLDRVSLYEVRLLDRSFTNSEETCDCK